MTTLINKFRTYFSYEDETSKRVVAEGTLWALVIQLTNPFYQLFVKELGGGDFAIALVNSLPALFALVILLPLSAYIETLPRKKPFVSNVILFYSFILPMMAITPFLGSIKVGAFIFFIALFNIPLLGYTVGWQGFFTEVLPENKRVMAYAGREMMRNYAQAFTMLVGGFVLSYVCVNSQQKIITYQILFLLAFVFAIWQRKTLLKTDDSHVETTEKKEFKPLKIFKMCKDELKKNKNFSSYLIHLVIFYISWQMAWPLFFIYVVEHLGANEFTKNILDVSSVLMFALASPFWGKYINKHGAKKAEIYGCFFAAAIMPAWLITCHSPVQVFINYVFGGIFSPALNLGLFNDMLEQLPKENRTLNIGIYNTVIQISAFISPLIGISIYRATSIEFTMIFASIFRTFAVGLLVIRYFKMKKQLTV